MKTIQSFDVVSNSIERILSRRKIGFSLLLLLATLLLVARIPTIWLFGRFWCEEGWVFIHNAATLPISLVLTNTYGGYWNFPTIIATMFAWDVFPHLYAPWVTTTIGLVCSLFPIVILLTAKDWWLRSVWTKLGVISCVLLVCPASETWLQTLHLQVTFDLCVALFIVLEPGTKQSSYFRYFVTSLAAVSGMGIWALIPLLLVRLLLEYYESKKYTEDCFYWSILMGIALIGGVIELYTYHDFIKRSHQLLISCFPTEILFREVLQPIYGITSVGHCIGRFIGKKLQHHPDSIIWIPFDILFTFIFVGLGCLGISKKKYRPIFWLVASNLIFTVAVFRGGMMQPSFATNPWVNERYFVVGQTLWALSILFLWRSSEKIIYRIFFRTLFIIMTAMGFWSYLHPVWGGQNIRWQQEYKIWLEDHHYRLRQWTDHTPPRLNLLSKDYAVWRTIPCRSNLHFIKKNSGAEVLDIIMLPPDARAVSDKYPFCTSENH